VTFSNQDHAFTVGEDGAAFRSSNGGTTFQPMTVAGTTDLYEIRFPSPMNGYICGDSGTIARSSDGGESWIVERLLGYEGSAFYAMEWLDKKIGLIAGGSRQVAHGQLAVPHGFVLRTTDAGLTWENVLSSSTDFFWSIAVERDRSGNAVPHVTSYGLLTQGGIRFSEDWGEDWQIGASGLPFLPHDISFSSNENETRGLTVGGNPFYFQARPRVALFETRTKWNVLPDTLPQLGFAWSVEVSPVERALDSIGAVVLGFQNGDVWTSYNEILQCDSQEKVSSCAIYDIAGVMLAGSVGVETKTLACGSGRGLYRKVEQVVVSTHEFPFSNPSVSTLLLYPSPVHRNELLNVSFPATCCEDGRIQLVDLLGRFVADSSYTIDSDTRQIPIRIGSIQPGIYFVLLSSSSFILLNRIHVLP